MFHVEEATGCSFDRDFLLKEKQMVNICDYGASVDETPVNNTEAINEAIIAVSNNGGTVIVPKGVFKVYTIRLKSNVNIYFEKGAVLQAAKTDIYEAYQKQVGEGGNYEEPEVNPYVGLQDHGHSYFANSLLYGVDIKNVMIYGNGLIDGSAMNDQGNKELVLLGGDPLDPIRRDENGHQGEWFGNKAIALVRCQNIALCDFSILAGGHFAIITTCVEEMLVDKILVDTNRDAFDVDCCQNVTITNSTFNSLTDDALVMKASYGGGIFMPLENVLIEDCKVSGYDMGSVYDETYRCDKLVATDRCGPTARVKLGTESTCGYNRVTIRRVHFSRSRGFALEAVDGSDLSNIIFEDSTMENISSSPIFVRAGDRGRFPVTGHSDDESIAGDSKKIRVDQKQWVLPNKESYTSYPARRYQPAYNRSDEVSVDGLSSFSIVSPKESCVKNPLNYTAVDGKYYLNKYDEPSKRYVMDSNNEIEEQDLVLYGNAVGSERIAKVYNIIIRNIKVTNADPRYPIELMGLVDSKIENIHLESVEVEYRGGLSMQHAVEQRQLNSKWTYGQDGEEEKHTQSIPWLVNTFFLKNEGLLPRVSWNAVTKSWDETPFNIPEMPQVYPEPSNWGILPAYGLYARHVEGLYIDNFKASYYVKDNRHPIVLDNVQKGYIKNVDVQHEEAIAPVVKVNNSYKRATNCEYIKNCPYQRTTVEDIEIEEHIEQMTIEVSAPAPGTPKDNLYNEETVPTPDNGYRYETDTNKYTLPQTVHRPFFKRIKDIIGKKGEVIRFDVMARQPAYELSSQATESMIYNEALAKKEYNVEMKSQPMKLSVDGLPDGVELDCSNFEPGVPMPIIIDTKKMVVGQYKIVFTADDGVIPEKMSVIIEIID